MTNRRRLATAGTRGQLVRLFLEQTGRVRRYVVQWGPRGARRQESWPGTSVGKREAEAFFRAFDAEQTRRAHPAPITTRALWLAFVEAEAPHLRPRSLALYSGSWRKWEQFTAPDAAAEAVTVQQMHDFRRALDAQGLATATVKNLIRDVRLVYNFGERMELLTRNRWHLFTHKVAKERRTAPRAEYRADEFLAIWRALDPEKATQWRAWVAVGLLGIYGNRQHEILNLRWSWVTDDAVRIAPDVVKTGEAATLTLFPLTRGILDVARRWRTTLGYTGDYVLFPGQSPRRAHPSRLPHYSIQTLTNQIHRAEARAQVPQVKWRAGHGFRRGLVGDLAEQTGDVAFALQAIGDRDLRMAAHYRLRRDDRVAGAVKARAERLATPEDTPQRATDVQSSPESNLSLVT